MRPCSANVLVCRDAREVAAEAASRFVCAALRSTAARGRFVAAIPGGWSPRATFEMLATPEFAREIPWEKTHIFFTDERAVSPDHEDSNYRLARDLLLSKVPIPERSVHRFLAELMPDEAAALYEQEIRRAAAGEPLFDLVMLGMGSDTHTASLFPESPALDERERLAVPNHIDKLGACRLTLTISALCSAQGVMILTLGEGKAEALRDVLQGEPDERRHPVQSIRPTGRLLWIIDQPAASML